jgi:hypothetical protein
LSINHKMSNTVAISNCHLLSFSLNSEFCWTFRGGKKINHLKPSGFFTSHQVELSKILHGARYALSVLHGSQNRQRPLLYTSLTDWFL